MKDLKVFASCQYYFQEGLFLSTFKLYQWEKELDTIWTIFITLIEIYKIFANLIGQNDLDASIYMFFIINMLKIRKNYSSVHCLIMLYVHLREYSLLRRVVVQW